MNHDLFLNDTERLKTIASDDMVKQGLAFFSEKRVYAPIVPLYGYAEQFDFADESLLGGAVDEAILERVKKGRNEVNVKLLSGNDVDDGGRAGRNRSGSGHGRRHCGCTVTFC